MSNLDLSQAVDLGALMHKAAEDKAKQLPEPTGYRILCAIPEAEKEYEGGILKSDEALKHDELLTTVLFVVAMSPDCLKTQLGSLLDLGANKGILF